MATPLSIFFVTEFITCTAWPALASPSDWARTVRVIGTAGTGVIVRDESAAAAAASGEER